MAIPSREKTFGLESCRDLLNKLEWEEKRLKDTDEQDVEGLMYNAFNAAVTAWHIGDWVWGDMSPEQRKALQGDWGVTLDKQGIFQTALRDKAPALNICREIATASKHVKVTQYPDHTIDANVSAKASNVTVDGETVTVNGSPVTTTVWVIEVFVSDQPVPFQKVLEEAISFWHEFIYHRGIAR